MKFKELRNNLFEKAMTGGQMQAAGAPAKPKRDDTAAKIRAAVSTLGLKGMNPSTIASAYKQYQQHGNLMRLPPTLRKQYMDFSGEVPAHLFRAPLNQFQSNLQKIKQIKRLTSQLNNSFEITDKDQISESVFKHETTPPFMMVLKRTGIRIFPDGKRVALYVNEKLGITFSIPYSPGGTNAKEIIPGVQSEETEYDDEILAENMGHINNILKTNKAQTLKFRDGTSADVDAHTARAISRVHNALNDANKVKVAKMMTQSSDQFAKLVGFAHQNSGLGDAKKKSMETKK